MVGKPRDVLGAVVGDAGEAVAVDEDFGRGVHALIAGKRAGVEDETVGDAAVGGEVLAAAALQLFRGGPVRDVVYEDVCIKDTKNPILMDSNYSYSGPARDKLPEFTDIVLRNVRLIGPGKITLDGFDATHRLGIAFDNVTLDDPANTKISGIHALITLGPGPVNFRPAGDDLKIAGVPGQGTPNACDGKFVPLPVKTEAN